ncbi:hypothetical protein PIB30_070684 [Stylosanthes scabra]|uniref:Uncharacterized protein n=1 Tax=Stylosanthes scabra TaxID=79078 RepID=A0ABU6QP81_9FABA|nr:hypothetical protein [Stylosanthes scabra]
MAISVVENNSHFNSGNAEAWLGMVDEIIEGRAFVYSTSSSDNNNVYFDPEQDKISSSSSTEAGLILRKEIEQDVKEEELDVETVLVKQETHDLFCPNCNSCITKRVILKKRKRSFKNSSDTEAKRGKSSAESDVGIIEPNFEPEREPELFRCLSCFSFFLPRRNGTKLIPNSGGARGPETSKDSSIKQTYKLEDPSIMAASKGNCFFSLCASNQREKSREQDLHHLTLYEQGQHSLKLSVTPESLSIEGTSSILIIEARHPIQSPLDNR